MKKREETLYTFKDPNKMKHILIVQENGLHSFLHIGELVNHNFESQFVAIIKKATKKGITAEAYSYSEKPIVMYLKWNEIEKVEIAAPKPKECLPSSERTLMGDFKADAS